MPQTSTDIQKQYEGFLNTPNLWVNHEAFGLTQFNPTELSTVPFEGEVSEKLRLGNRVEQFFFFQLQQTKNINLLAQNLQIFQNKISLGELDCLLMYNNQPIHLEICYKFYLYDESLGQSPLDKWIGPNRNDSLVQKLEKLKTKQFPLLHSKEATETLRLKGLDASLFNQRVLFKAQLYLPLKQEGIDLAIINPDCVKGFFIKREELQALSANQFHIPRKHNWLTEAHHNVTWLSCDLFEVAVDKLLKDKRSPLCWMRDSAGRLQRLFVVWW